MLHSLARASSQGSREELGAALPRARDERAWKGSRAESLGLGLGDPTAKASKCSQPEGKGEFPEKCSQKKRAQPHKIYLDKSGR